QLSQLFIYQLAFLLIYLLIKQNITNFFTYSSQHNQNTNENNSFLPLFLLHIYLIPYLYFKIKQYWCRGCKRFRHRNSLVQKYHNFDALLRLFIYQLAFLLIYLLIKQNITNFFTYSSQHNQNTNENNSFLPLFLLHIYLIPYLYFKWQQYWCRGCKRFRHRNSLVQKYHNFEALLN
ncbi:kinase domain protein, partial (macronuclear) [Tetrahymena thermophila SB210]